MEWFQIGSDGVVQGLDSDESRVVLTRWMVPQCDTWNLVGRFPFE